MSEPISYQVCGVRLRLIEVGGSERSIKAATTALSPEALWLDVGSYLHPGTIAEVDITPCGDGSPLHIRGVIETCDHKKGVVHAAVLRFERRLDIDNVVQDDAENPDDPYKGPDVSLLLVEDHEAHRFLVNHRFGGTRFKVTSVSTIGQALDALKAGRFDVVLSGLHLHERTGVELLEQAVPDLHTGPFVFVTGEPDIQKRRDLLQHGAQAVVSKPINFDRLARVLADLMQGRRRSMGLDDDTPDLGPESEVGELFVAMLAADRDSLLRSCAHEDVESARSVCRDIHGCACGFGFDQLGRAATRALAVLDITGEIEASSDALAEVRVILDRLIPDRAA